MGSSAAFTLFATDKSRISSARLLYRCDDLLLDEKHDESSMSTTRAKLAFASTIEPLSSSVLEAGVAVEPFTDRSRGSKLN